MDENGNWYRGEEGADKDADEGADGKAVGDDGLTDAERAILADLDGPRR